jgi:hypothetical protein
MKIKLLPLLLVLLIMPSIVRAAGQDEPVIYVIKQGDTLWGLSERFIKDPYYWPNMWSKNGQITNPHFIYPGQKVRVFPDRIELVPTGSGALPSQSGTPAVTPTAAVANEPLRDVAAEKTYTLYGSEGCLVEKEFRPFGLVVGAQHDRIVTGVDDILYTDIGSELNAKAGDKFSIYRKDISVKHPLNNEEMGFKSVPLGTLQLTDVEKKASRAIITQSFREISPGAYLLPYKENHRREITLKNTNVDLKGYIIESLSGISVIAAGDVVYIDLGSSQGAAVGNLLYVVRDVSIDQRYVEGRIDTLPQEVLGALVILDTGKKSSTALVVKSIDTIYKGDRIVSQTK